MMNEFEVIVVEDDLRRQGITNYNLRPGNNCIWVTAGQVSMYYVFSEGKLTDIQVD
jgi:hypothetical protein